MQIADGRRRTGHLGVSRSTALTLRRGFAFFTAAILAGCAGAADAPSALGPVPHFQVRPGYRVSLAADSVENCRFLEFDDRGALFVSCPKNGDVLCLRDENGDGVYEKRTTFISGKPSAHGLCWRKPWLWVAQSRVILKARDTNGDDKADEIVTVIPQDELPGDTGHWWRSILVTDDSIYTSVGDPGNITDQTQTDREKIWRYNPDGKDKRLFCSGIRNTEKLRLRPGTGEVWGCDHGSDNYGSRLGEQAQVNQPVTDMTPPCEFNHYVQDAFYGHPFIVGARLPRLEYMDRKDILDWAKKSVPPAWSFGAHWAPNGFCFLSKDVFAEHSGDAFVALHGSWNSSRPVGYRIERVLFDRLTGEPYGSLRIVGTLGADGKVLARPVDCAEAPDGTVVWSCDYTNRIYRISPEPATRR